MVGVETPGSIGMCNKAITFESPAKLDEFELRRECLSNAIRKGPEQYAQRKESQNDSFIASLLHCLSAIKYAGHCNDPFRAACTRDFYSTRLETMKIPSSHRAAFHCKPAIFINSLASLHFGGG